MDAVKRQRLLAAIIAHASDRWCWDDESFLEEAFDRLYGPDDTPEAFVDALAADYNLTDPRDIGLISTIKESSMPNSNCLEGFCCPKCGSTAPFDIAVTLIKRMFDDGSEAYGNADEEWCDSSYCKCFKCDLIGTVATFRPRDAVAVDQRPVRRDLPVYDAVEIHPCALSQPEGETIAVFEQCEEDDPELAIWCVYLHCVAGGVQSLADCGTRAEAEAVADVVEKNLPAFQHIPCGAAS